VSRNTIALAPSAAAARASRAARPAPGRRAPSPARARRCPGRAQPDTVGVSSVTSSARQRAISPARRLCSALGREARARRCRCGHQRQPQNLASLAFLWPRRGLRAARPALRPARRRRAAGRAAPRADRLNRGQRQQHGGGFPLAGSETAPDRYSRGAADAGPRAGPVASTASTESHAWMSGRRSGRGRCGGGPAPSATTVSARRGDAAQLTERHDGVDHPMSLPGSRRFWDASGERFAVELFVHSRSEKADQSAPAGRR